MDPKLIKEQTGHKSEAVILYKKSNLKQKKEISDMLSVLPRQMDEIRASSLQCLLEKKCLEKRVKPSATVTSSEGVPLRSP